VGHDAALHTHLPPEQTWPLPHAVPPPQEQAPVAEQPSAVVPQLVHMAPAVPHAVADGVVHVVPEQQPLEHEVALHTHTPPEHAWPVAHAAAPPQVQAPVAEQPSAVMPQLLHVAPPVPQAAAEGMVQVVPEQQPPGQLAALQPLHAPMLQVWPVGHIVQLPPAAPHALGSVPGWHVLPWQHPFGHDVASQAHVPPEQTCPLAHAVPPPHVQAPLAEQPSAVEPQLTHAAPAAPHALVAVPGRHALPWQHPVGHDAGSQTHLPPEQACPVPHTAPPPQLQVPLAEQPSAVEPQLTHAAPPVPQAVADGVVHVPEAQHPLAHVVALQTVATSAGASMPDVSGGASTVV
jgi:hypothetical protein